MENMSILVLESSAASSYVIEEPPAQSSQRENSLISVVSF